MLFSVRFAHAPAQQWRGLALRDGRSEFVSQSRLANARRSDERHEMRSPLGADPIEKELQQCELKGPTDERVRPGKQKAADVS